MSFDEGNADDYIVDFFSFELTGFELLLIFNILYSGFTD